MPRAIKSLLVMLREFRPDPPLRWHEEDLCFLYLDLLRYVCKSGDAERLVKFQEVLAEHARECGGCWKNIQATGMATSDAARKETYLSLYVASLNEMIRLRDPALRMTPVEGGMLIRMGPPPGTEGVITGIEAFAPKDLKGSWQIVDVATRDLFDDPSPLLQILDEISVKTVQDAQSRPEWSVLQWESIFPTALTEVRVRWDGEIKVVAKDGALLPRYEGLLRKNMPDDINSEMCDDPRLRDSSPKGEAVLKVRELALKYNGRSRFSGFARRTLGFRGIDAYRKRNVDATAHVATALFGGGSGEAALDPVEAEGAILPADDREVNADLSLRMDRLLPRLSERERAIVELLSEKELSDGEIAKRLGVRRETVNRSRMAIREKARELGL